MRMLNHIFSVAAFFLLAMVSTCCCSGCHEEERSGLSYFKGGLNDSWYMLESPATSALATWRGSDCCSWEGITCNPHTGHVVRMDLSNFGFYICIRNSSTQFLNGLLQLQHLEYLDLSQIIFYPLPIPSQFAMLSRLTHLKLFNCLFTGRIPSFMGNMSGLKYLDVSYNFDLEGGQLGEWIGNLRGLEYLQLNYVNLTTGGDRVVENIAVSLANLTTLGMSECGVSGTILSSLANITSLSRLYLDGNDFTHQPFPNLISNLTSLVTLSLFDCGLRGPIPSPLLSLPHLRNLWLSYNPDLKVNLFSIVQHSRQLERLYLSGSNVAGVIPPSIGNLSRLQSLLLSGNSLTGSIPWTLALQKLSKLDLGSNQLNGSLPSNFGNLSSLVWLDLSNNSLSGIIPPSLGQLSSLEILQLEHNNFHGTFLLSVLANLTDLTQLDLSSNNLLTVKINGFWIPKFQLQYLGLRSCNIEGDFPIFISTQYDIEYLDLSNNSLKGDIPNWLWDVTYLYNLQMLDLSMNLFDGFAQQKLEKTNSLLCFCHWQKITFVVAFHILFIKGIWRFLTCQITNFLARFLRVLGTSHQHYRS